MADTSGGRSSPVSEPGAPRTSELLSFSEEFLWRMLRDGIDLAFLECPTHMSTVVRLENRLDVAALRNSVEEITRRHAVLRSRYRDAAEQPVRTVAAVGPVPWSDVDLRHLPTTEQPAAVRQRLLDEIQAPFDLEAGPLVRVTLVQLAADVHVFAVTIHHIAFDGESRHVFLHELGASYEAFAAGQVPALPPLAATYQHYVAWQRMRLPRETERRLMEAWITRLHDGADLALPYDRPSDGGAPDIPDTCRFHIDDADVTALRAMSRAAGATLAITMLGVFAAFLQSITGTADVAVGLPMSDRRRVEFEPLIGLFTNVLVLRLQMIGSPSLSEIVLRARRAMADAYAQQDLPYGRYLQARTSLSDGALPPPFRVTFNFMRGAPDAVWQIPGLRVEPMMLGQRLPGLADLSLQLWDRGDTVSGALSYNCALFSASLIARFVDHLRSCARCFVASPPLTLRDLPRFTG